LVNGHRPRYARAHAVWRLFNIMHELIWVGFFALILGLLVLDLGVLNRKPHAVSVKESLLWTAFWVTLAMVFNAFVYFIYEHDWMGGPAGVKHLSGADAAIQFFTAYLVEEMLSLDNIFVMSAIMTSFRVPAYAQHRVLFWGILGAIVLRGAMIFAGTAAIRQFSWLMYPLGALLVFTGGKMFKTDDDAAPDGTEHFAVRFVGRHFPVTREFMGTKFFVRVDGKLHITPLLLALIAVEFTDVIFAVDSVPAVFGVTLDPFIVMTSNIFAILGLRSLFFALRALLDRFRYLKPTVAIILVFVGLKMIAGEALGWHPPPLISLMVIFGLLILGVIASVAAHSEEQESEADPEKPVPLDPSGPPE
jgi:tellurite resistance protein TerC